MALSAADRELLAQMRQRELHLKRRQRAADAITFRLRRYRGVWSAAFALAFAAVVTTLEVLVARLRPGPPHWGVVIVLIALGAFLGALAGQAVWGSALGGRLLARKESALRDAYAGDLHAGRRWLSFQYGGEDIAPYVPQILYFIESEGRFDSVDEALAFAKDRQRPSHAFAARALEAFNEVAAQTNELVLSSADAGGQPSSRIMRFVRTERPGVWLVTTAPEGPKVRELDLGRVALVTLPTASGATITSNRVVVSRAGESFAEVARLYDEQVPGYTDGMSEEEREGELVYSLHLQSARVDTWLDHDVVVL